MEYDLIIIGAGPGGYNAAEKAAKAGLKVLVAEKNKVGGVCLNEGCVPTKTLLYSAKVFDNASNGKKYGVIAKDISIDHNAVVKRKDKVVKTLTSGIASSLKAAGVTVVNGEAKILKRENNLYQVSINDEAYSAKKLLIVTGSSPALPPINGLKEALESGFAVTNKEILDLKEVPEKLIVVGGGVIGLEMASYFSSVGSKVTVIEALDHIAGQTDSDLVDILQKTLEKKGVKFYLSSMVTEIKKSSVMFKAGDNEQEEDASVVLMSIGRRANTQNLGLENIGVETERGAIKTDEKMKTNAPEVYAAGDVNGKSMLAHTAYREGEVAINNILGKKDTMLYNAIPSVIYTNPEIAGVGETEQTAKEKNIDIDVVSVSMRFSGRYLAENDGGNGIFKLIVEKKNKTIIGAHAIANYASEFIIAAGIMVQMKLNIEDVKTFVFPHPTVGEIIREAVFHYNMG